MRSLTIAGQFQGSGAKKRVTNRRLARAMLRGEGGSVHMEFSLDNIPIRMTCTIVGGDDFEVMGTRSFSHRKPFHLSRLFCFARGRAQFTSATESRQFIPGVIYLIPSGLAYDIVHHDTHLHFFHLHVSDFTHLSVFDDTSEVLALEDQYLFDKVIESQRTGEEQLALSSLSLIIAQMTRSIRDTLAARSIQTGSQRAVLEHISQTPPAQININELADELRVSRSTLSKNFSRSVGCSLKAYINALTLQKARERLRYSDDSVESIADELGFNQVTYFYRFFKKHAGMTPLEYRR